MPQYSDRINFQVVVLFCIVVNIIMTNAIYIIALCLVL